MQWNNYYTAKISEICVDGHRQGHIKRQKNRTAKKHLEKNEVKIILSTQFLDLLYSSAIKVLWCLQKKKQNKSRKK